jgi:PIN domain nuclease of toxin-antitoxin system
VKLLLDTNAFLRWAAGTPLHRPVERVLSKRETERLVSIVTGWEIMIKPKLGISAADFEAAIDEMGAMLLPIRFKHLSELAHLPFYENHKDPFDRMLIAQAIAEDVSIVTSDMRFDDYKRLRVLWD